MFSGVVTNVGATLLNRWASEEKALIVARASCGTGTVSELKTQTSVANEVHDVSIASKRVVIGGTKFKIQIVPATTALVVKQVGLWAKLEGDSNNILLALFQDTDGINVPSQTDMPDYVYNFFALVSMSNTGTMVVNVDTDAVVNESELFSDIRSTPIGSGALGEAIPETVTGLCASALGCTVLPPNKTYSFLNLSRAQNGDRYIQFTDLSNPYKQYLLSKVNGAWGSKAVQIFPESADKSSDLTVTFATGSGYSTCIVADKRLYKYGDIYWYGITLNVTGGGSKIRFTLNPGNIRAVDAACPVSASYYYSTDIKPILCSEYSNEVIMESAGFAVGSIVFVGGLLFTTELP